MMKRKFLAVILPIIGCATLVGSGFSAWYFSEAVAGGEDTAGIAVDVTEKVSSNLSISLNHNSNLKDTDTYLILDQGKSTIDDANYDSKGIMFNDSSVDDIVEDKDFDLIIDASYKGNAEGAGGLTLERIRDNNLKLVIKIDVQLSNTLAKYIKVKDGTYFTVDALVDKNTFDNIETDTDNIVVGAEYTTYSYELEPNLTHYNGTTLSETWTFTLDLSTEGYANNYFTYKSRGLDNEHKYCQGKPRLAADYDFMQTDLADNAPTTGGHFNINMSFDMVPVTTGA